MASRPEFEPLPTPPADPVQREQFPVGSRLSRSGLEKFLTHGEHVVYATTGTVQVGEQRKRVYLTNRRLLLHRKDGIVITRDSLDAIDLRAIGRTTLTEVGMFMKDFILEIDGMQMRGRRTDLMNLYRALHTVKATPLQ
ncbi:MAG: hypothetical protein OK422_06485 [Thaumarchaeota archaeon]|nr:hypothetical protein [Nitrososphaerota archaeon]